MRSSSETYLNENLPSFILAVLTFTTTKTLSLQYYRNFRLYGFKIHPTAYTLQYQQSQCNGSVNDGISAAAVNILPYTAKWKKICYVRW